ncbi:MAG: pentapeptide repeat-containing protein [Paludibaculum sp.]
MALKRRKETAPRRSPADLPASLDDLTLLSLDDLLEGEDLEEALFRDLDLAGRNLSRLVGSSVVFQGVNFSGTTIRAPRLRDVRFLNCDLSNADWRGFEAIRVEFIDCRLMGMGAVECHWKDVLLDRCEARYLRLNSGQTATCEFRTSNLAEADLRSANLEGAILDNVSLQKSDLSRSILKGVDLSLSDIEGITVFPEDVRGASVSAPQAMDLARLLGLTIK